MRITVLTGGASAERDVALASARQVVPALRQAGHHVVVVDTATGFVPESREADHLLGKVGATPPSVAELQARERSFLLTSLGALPEVREADVNFLVLHGGRGEDGTIQTILDTLDVVYTGSGALGSALAMDKDVSKRLFLQAGVPTAKWRMTPVSAGEAGHEMGWPVVVKPSKQGSTVGLTVVKRPEDFDRAVWFASDVLPCLRQRNPAVRFYIVGRSPDPAVQALAGEGVVVTGTVDDVRPYLAHAAVVVAPLRIARGIQNKVLEAMAMARPVVASVACAGPIAAKSKEELLTADSADDYISHIESLLADRARADAIGQAARRRVLASYSWDAHLGLIDRYLEDNAT